MKTSRKTQKLVMASRIIAEILEERMSNVLEAYDAKEAYLQMQAMGFYWNKDLQTWHEKGVNHWEQRRATRTPVRAAVRIMCDDRASVEAVRSYLMELIESVGGSIESVGGIADNRGNDGARSYFDILV